jgi:uncharacterized spore protein YtfJ
MQLNFDEMLERITSFLKAEVKTETVVGEPFQLGEFTCIPVIRTGMGFGGGEGEAVKQGHGEGIGAGLGIEPIGFLAAHKDQISFISTKSNKGLAAAFEQVPDLISKYMDMNKKEKEPAVV